MQPGTLGTRQPGGEWYCAELASESGGLCRRPVTALGTRVFSDPIGELGARDGAAEVETLGEVATHPSQRIEHLNGLHAFRDHPATQAMAELENRAHDRLAGSVRRHVGDEGPVDLDDVDR